VFWLGSSTSAGATGSGHGVLFPWAELVILRTAFSLAKTGAIGAAFGVGARPFCWLFGREQGRLNASDVGGRIASEKRNVSVFTLKSNVGSGTNELSVLLVCFILVGQIPFSKK